VSKTKLIRILCGILLAGVLLVEGLAFALVWRLNMVPAAYMVLLAAFLLILWLGLSAILFLPGKKKKKRSRRQVLGTGRMIGASILVVVILLGCGAAANVTSQLYQTLDSIAGPTELTVYVDIFVRQDDKAQTISDLKGYTVAITEHYDIDNTRKALEQLESKLGQKVTTLTCSGVFAMTDALLAGEADAMMINAAYISLLEDAKEYADFETKARLLTQIDISIPVQKPQETKPGIFDWLIPGKTEPTEPSQPTEPVEQDEYIQIPEGNVTDVPFVMYLAGTDSKKHPLASHAKNDVNILAVVNPRTKQVLLINTPRDYFIPNPAGNGAMDKLTHCGIAGVENSLTAISQLYRIPIRYHVQVGFDGLKKLVNAVDGVDVYSEVAYIATGIQIQKGMNHLYGEEALAFARERKNIDGGDNARGNNQMKIIKAILKKMMSGKLLTRYTDIMNSLRGLFRTSMPLEDISELVKMQLKDMASWNIVTYSVTGDATNKMTYSTPEYPPVFVYIPKMDTVEYARELIQRIVDGEVINQEDIIPAE